MFGELPTPCWGLTDGRQCTENSISTLQALLQRTMTELKNICLALVKLLSLKLLFVDHWVVFWEGYTFLSPSWALLHVGLWSRLALQALPGHLLNKRQPNGANQSPVGFFSHWSLWSHSWHKPVPVALGRERRACRHLTLSGLRHISLPMEEGIAQDLLEHPPRVLPALGLPCLQGGCSGGHPRPHLQPEPALWGSHSFAEMVFMAQPQFCILFSVAKGHVTATYSSQNLWVIPIRTIVELQAVLEFP